MSSALARPPFSSYSRLPSTTSPAASTSALQTYIRASWSTRHFQSSCRCLAEEVPSSMPFESNILNLLSNNEEFKDLVTKFAERMQVLLGIDVNEGQMPSMTDMMRCSQDPELQQMSIKLTKILQDDGINLSPDTLKYIWENMQGRGR